MRPAIKIAGLMFDGFDMVFQMLDGLTAAP